MLRAGMDTVGLDFQNPSSLNQLTLTQIYWIFHPRPVYIRSQNPHVFWIFRFAVESLIYAQPYLWVLDSRASLRLNLSKPFLYEERKKKRKKKKD